MVNYSPVVSEPITARVISPDVPNKQVYVQIKGNLLFILLFFSGCLSQLTVFSMYCRGTE